MIYHTYVNRAKCGCGFIWTTAGDNPPETISDSVICACGSSEFSEGVLYGEAIGVAVNSDEFNQAVADDIGVDVENLTVVKY